MGSGPQTYLASLYASAKRSGRTRWNVFLSDHNYSKTKTTDQKTPPLSALPGCRGLDGEELLQDLGGRPPPRP
jgi:hypothetical protein